MKLRMILIQLFVFVLIVVTIPAKERALKATLTFKENNSRSHIVLTKDSVGILKLDSISGELEMDSKHGFVASIRKRALSGSEKDTAKILIGLAKSFKGRDRYTCASKDGYAFSIWSETLTLHCENCFSCSDDINIQEAKTLARFGKLTLWLHRINEGKPEN